MQSWQKRLVYEFYATIYKLDKSKLLVASHQLPGHIDVIGSSKKENTCYAVMPSASLPVHKWLNTLPPV